VSVVVRCAVELLLVEHCNSSARLTLQVPSWVIILGGNLGNICTVFCLLSFFMHATPALQTMLVTKSCMLAAR
jgi:hypothetical protein